MTTIGKLPFEAALALFAGLALAVIIVGDKLNLGLYSLLLLGIPLALAIWFLLEYRKLPLKERAPPPDLPPAVAPMAPPPAGALGETPSVSEAIIPLEDSQDRTQVTPPP